MISWGNQAKLSGMTQSNNNQDQDQDQGPPQHPESSPPPGDLWSTWSPGRILVLAVLLIAGNFIFQILFYGMGGGLFLPVLAGTAFGVFLPLLLMIRKGGLRINRDLGLNYPGPGPLLAAAAVALAALVPTSLLAELSMRMHPVDPSWVALFNDNLPSSPLGYAAAFVAVVLAAPLAEEIIFRGLLHRLASRLWGGVAGTILSSLAFALIHGEPWFLFGLVGVGLVLALVYETTRSVTACWVTHAVHNGISLGLMISREEVVTETGPIALQDWVWCGLSLAVLLGLVRWLRTESISRKPATHDQY